MGEPFPFRRDGRSAVQRFMDGTIDLCELLGRKQLILSYQTGPGGKVLLGLSVVLKVMAPAEPGFGKVPFPGGKLYAIPGRLARQHCAVELSQELVAALHSCHRTGSSPSSFTVPVSKPLRWRFLATSSKYLLFSSAFMLTTSYYNGVKQKTPTCWSLDQQIGAWFYLWVQIPSNGKNACNRAKI